MSFTCPICGKIVNDFSESGGLNPCEHLVAWGTIGNEEVYWKNSELEEKYEEFCEKDDEKDDDDDDDNEYIFVEDKVEEFADSYGLDYYVHSDEAGHGHSTAMFLVFPS